MKKIVLGTAQLGMDYGINNSRGRIPPSEAIEILSEAVSSGIDMFDTASLYGESQKIIGSFIANSNVSPKIISKLPNCKVEEVHGIFDSSLQDLSVASFYAYLIHSFPQYKNYPEVWNKLRGLKENGKIQKIGFSLYYPYELEYLFRNNVTIDIVQVPFSIFDQRFAGYFPKLAAKGIEIHCRSVFLQGLVFKNPHELSDRFRPIADKLQDLNELAGKLHVPVLPLCLAFALDNKFIDKVVLGVDNIAQLREIMNISYSQFGDRDLIGQLVDFKVNEEDMLLPFNWNN